MKKLMYTTMLIGSLALSGAAHAQILDIDGGTPILNPIPVTATLLSCSNSVDNSYDGFNNSVARAGAQLALQIRNQATDGNGHGTIYTSLINNKTFHLSPSIDLYNQVLIIPNTNFFYYVDQASLNLGLPEGTSGGIYITTCSILTKAQIYTPIANATNAALRNSGYVWPSGFTLPTVVYP